jgi:subtilase family serine protease
MKLSAPRFIGGVLLVLVSCGLVASSISGTPSPSRKPVRLHGHVPVRAMAEAELEGRLGGDCQMSMTFALPLRNQEELQTLLKRLYDPADPICGRYLSVEEFTERFGPTQEDYDAVAAYARNLGLTITGTHPNRLLLDVSGPAATVEAGFNLSMYGYQAASGREFFAPDEEPEVPGYIASRVIGIVGLEDANQRRPHSYLKASTNEAQSSPQHIGTGPGGGLSPDDIVKAYNLQSTAANGSGETLALFELDGYSAVDIAVYLSYYGLPSVPVQNILVDGYSGNAGRSASEPTLDIELQIALAPGASRILVYEGPNTNTGVLHTYNRIATDNLARQISTSWGMSETDSSSVTLNAENSIFQQMAAQGQTIYAAAGDNGAYDSGSRLSVDDPASQPYVVATGGTQLFVKSDGTHSYESVWNTNNTVRGGAGGGGISSVWSIPSWQRNYVPSSSLGSAGMRNVPDVSLNADPQSGYSIYYRGGWYVYGGTSCAAPLWAAFNARINQLRIQSGAGPLGFASPWLYQLAGGSQYGADFHDVADGTTNLYYRAVAGYDNATGWGSFNGAGLLADLASSSSSVTTSIKYYNAQGQAYTNEDVAYWQTAVGQWWRGDKSGKIVAVSSPPWLTSSVIYYNAAGQLYTNEAVAYWQTGHGEWWMGDKSGKITAISLPPWLAGGRH